MRCTHHHHPNLNCKEILQSFWYHLSPYSCTQNLCSCDHTNNLIGYILIVWAIPRSKGQEFTTNKLTQVERSLQVPTSHSQMESCLCSSQSSAARGTQLSFCLFLLPLLREHLGVTTQRSSWGSSSHEIHQWLHCRDLNNLSKRTIILVSLALSNVCAEISQFPSTPVLVCSHSSNTCEILHLPRATAPWSLELQPWDLGLIWLLESLSNTGHPYYVYHNKFEKNCPGHSSPQFFEATRVSCTTGLQMAAKMHKYHRKVSAGRDSKDPLIPTLH